VNARSKAPFRLALPLLAAALALPSAAGAEAEADAPSGESGEARPRATASRALAVWGPSTLEGGGAVTRETLDRLLPPGDPFPARVLRLSDWLETPAFQITGNSEAIPCAAPAAEIEVGDGKTEVSALTAHGLALLDDLEPEAALGAFATAVQRLPCQDAFLSKETLSRLWFYAGIAAYVNGDSSASTGHFRQTASIDPTQPWDPSYPTEPQSTFLSAVQEVVSSPKARIFGDMRGTEYVEVWFDGQRLDLDKAIERTALPGVHVIQAVDAGGVWNTFVHRLDSGGRLLLFSADGLEQTILDGPDSALESVATSTLHNRASDEILTDVFVVRIDPEAPGTAQVRTFDPRKKTWGKLKAGPVATASREAPRAAAAAAPAVSSSGDAPQAAPLSRKQQTHNEMLREPRYRTGAAVGMKLFQLQRCPGAEVNGERCPDGTMRSSDYIGGLVLIDVRIIGGLNLDVRLGMTATDLKLGGTLLPEVGAGLRYRFLTGPLQPYLGGAADFFAGTTRDSVYNPTNKVVIYGGLLGFGGIDFEFADGFRLSFEGGGGIIINPDESSDGWPMGHFMFGIGRFL
jgi:hypothetical protein